MEEKIVNEEEKNKKKKNHPIIKTILIIIIILLLLIIIATSVCYGFLLKNKKEIINKNTDAIILKEEKIEYGSNLTYKDILEKTIIMDKLYEDTIVKIYINNNLISEDEEYLFNIVGDIDIKIETYNKILPFFEQQELVNKEIT